VTALSDLTRQISERVRRVNPYAVDAVLALAFTVGALWTVASRLNERNVYREDDALSVLLVLLQTLPVAVRRVMPLGALALSVLGIGAHISIGYQGVAIGTFAALVILYSAASLTDTPRALLAALITAAGIIVYFATDRGDPGAVAAVTTGATYAAAWFLGVYARSRREYTHVVEERAALLEREREVQAREAVASERSRIARELHDMVGHALNVIVIQAGAAQRVVGQRPEAARDALTSIESAARDALTDMERMLGILRASDEGEPLSPQPGLGAVSSLAARVGEAGLPVEVTVEGVPVALPASIDLSAYRIIQEALTNALKHAGPAHAAVHIRYAPDSLDLEIVDDGRGASGRAGEGGEHRGRGLIGMTERVNLFGGVLDVGPRPGGGFRVHARLPLEGAPL